MMTAKMPLTQRIQWPPTIVHLRHLHSCKIHKYWIKVQVWGVNVTPQLILRLAQRSGNPLGSLGTAPGVSG